MLGIDAGSTTVKVAEYSDGEAMYLDLDSASRMRYVVGEYLDRGFYATGYFRKRVPATGTVTEITAAIEGTAALLVEVDAIIDMGGQDTKVILVRENKFTINDKCSAGTGAFLDQLAAYLGVGIGELAGMRGSSRPVDVNSTCTVFALSEVISHLASGIPREDVVSGFHMAYARKVAAMLPKRVGTVAAIGGVALNKGVTEALQELLEGELLVPERPQFVNAVGAAVHGARKMKN